MTYGRPCDSCAGWFSSTLLTTLWADEVDDVILLCPACYEWRTGVEPPPYRGG